MSAPGKLETLVFERGPDDLVIRPGTMNAVHGLFVETRDGYQDLCFIDGTDEKSYEKANQIIRALGGRMPHVS